MDIKKFPTGALVKNKYISGKIYKVESQDGAWVVVTHNDYDYSFDHNSLIRIK